MKIFKKKETQSKNSYIEKASSKSGKSYDEMYSIMTKAKNEFGISFSEFTNKKYYELSLDEINELYKKRFIANEKQDTRIKTIMLHTDWSYEEAKSVLMSAKEERGISNRDFMKYELFFIEPDKQLETLERKKNEREKREAQREVNKIKRREKYICKVVEETGWTQDYAIKMMEECESRCGKSFEHYAAYRFWEIEPERQNTYFTKGQADSLKAKYNTDKLASRIMINKDLFSRHYEEFLGREWMSNLNMDFEEFKTKFLRTGKIIYKPRASTGGNGIEVFDFDESSIKNVFDTVGQLPEGIVEKFLVQHEDMAKLSLKSVNSLRVVTIHTNDKSSGIEINKVHIVYVGLRMGCGDKYVDNMHSGGLIAGVDKETGIVTTEAMNFKYEVFEKHPDTGTAIKGFQIPMFKEVIELVTHAASKAYGYYGWDVAITIDGPVILEANTHPGSEILQTPYLPQKKGMKYVVEEFL